MDYGVGVSLAMWQRRLALVLAEVREWKSAWVCSTPRISLDLGIFPFSYEIS